MSWPSILIVGEVRVSRHLTDRRPCALLYHGTKMAAVLWLDGRVRVSRRPMGMGGYWYAYMGACYFLVRYEYIYNLYNL